MRLTNFQFTIIIISLLIIFIIAFSQRGNKVENNFKIKMAELGYVECLESGVRLWKKDCNQK